MQDLDRILVSLDRSDGAAVVLEKAVAMARASNAALEVVHVIYEGIVDLPVCEVEKNQELKTFIMQTGETWLEDQLDCIRCKVKNIESVTLWNKDKWQGILKAAAASGADLIIKGVEKDDEYSHLIRTPQDTNLIRHSEIPVMLVKDDAWVSNPVVLAAIDVLNESQTELNKRILTEAKHLSTVLGGELAIAVSYPMIEAWVEPSTVPLDLSRLRCEIEQTIRSKVSQLVSQLGICYRYLHVEEGKPAMRIRNLLEETGSELLVIGTVGRTGVKSLVIGNTSETILQYTHCDVVVLR